MRSELLQQVARAAREHFSWACTPAIQTLERIQGEYSEVTRLLATCGTDRRILYAKYSYQGADRDDPVKCSPSAEFNILRTLNMSSGSFGGVEAVRPVAVFPAEKIVVTEGAPGKSLEQIVRDGCFYLPRGSVGRATSACHRAGAWLKRFQSLTEVGLSEFEIGSLIQYSRIRLDTISESNVRGAAMDHSILDEMRRKFELRSPFLVCVTGRHNDFSPHNMVLDANELRIFDFGFFDQECFAYDVYRFWHKLECMKLDPRISRRRVRILQSSFLSGFGNAADLSLPVFDFVSIRFNLALMATISVNKPTPGPRAWLYSRLYAWCRNSVLGALTRL